MHLMNQEKASLIVIDSVGCFLCSALFVLLLAMCRAFGNKNWQHFSTDNVKPFHSMFSCFQTTRKLK